MKKNVILIFVLIISIFAKAQDTGVEEYFDDSGISTSINFVKFGYSPFKGEFSGSYERGLGLIGAIEVGVGMINAEKFSSFYINRNSDFKLPESVLEKNQLFNIWIQPKLYFNENYHNLYLGVFVGITKMSPEILTDLIASIGYKQRIFTNFSIELQSGVGGRFYTNTFYLGGVPYKEQMSIIVIPLTFKVGYLF